MRARTRRIPLVLSYGTLDPFDVTADEESVVAHWLIAHDWMDDGAANGSVPLAPAATRTGTDGKNYSVDTYVDAQGCVLAERWLIEGLFHAYAGGDQTAPYDVISDPNAPDMRQMAYEFFIDRYDADGPPGCETSRRPAGGSPGAVGLLLLALASLRRRAAVLVMLLCSAAAHAGPPAVCPGKGCPRIDIAGDASARNRGTFRGFADPAIAHDPAVPGRMWLAYSWPHVVAGTDPAGKRVQLAAVRNHLARSDDGGAHFRFTDVLWPAVSARDPEGSGQMGMLSSETASLATLQDGGTVTWYGAHLRYFLQAQTGYNPKYATSWTVRVGAAASPQALGSAAETVLGVSTTAGAYQPAAQLDRLAGLPIQHCAMLNNPTLFAEGRTLYLVVECLAFVGTTLDFEHSTVQVFATQPRGAPRSWRWRHAGRLGGRELARELGHATIQQPDVSLGADGKRLLLITPADDDDPAKVGTLGAGCVALEIASLDPPALARDSGKLRVRGQVRGSGVGACTHDRASAAGVVVTTQGWRGGKWALHASGVRP